MNRGGVVLAPFAYSDLQGLKRRPAVVVSSDAYGSGADVILAMITSSNARLSSPGLGDVVLTDWQAAGLRVASVARTGRLLVIEQRLVGTKLGSLTGVDLAKIDVALRDVFGLT